MMGKARGRAVLLRPRAAGVVCQRPTTRLAVARGVPPPRRVVLAHAAVEGQDPSARLGDPSHQQKKQNQRTNRAASEHRRASAAAGQRRPSTTTRETETKAAGKDHRAGRDPHAALAAAALAPCRRSAFATRAPRPASATRPSPTGRRGRADPRANDEPDQPGGVARGREDERRNDDDGAIAGTISPLSSPISTMPPSFPLGTHAPHADQQPKPLVPTQPARSPRDNTPATTKSSLACVRADLSPVDPRRERAGRDPPVKGGPLPQTRP